MSINVERSYLESLNNRWLCGIRSITAATSSRLPSGLIVDIVPPFGSRNSEATMLAR